ncbi:SMI1/KNR4 family protein [Bacillus sp. C1-1]|nr:SMI1/KNR4 family protein [Bacillus sp. C1-1]
MQAIWAEDNMGISLESATDTTVREAEERLGVVLPLTYVALVKVQNGGSLTANAVPSPSKDIQEPYIEVEELFGIGDGGIYDSPYLIKEWDLPAGIVLFSGTGHSWLAFDYRQTKENPPIVYFEVDAETMEYPLADHFDAFLEMLYVEEGEEWEDADDEDEILTHQAFEALMKEKNSEKLRNAIERTLQSEMDYEWLGNIYLKLSTYPTHSIRAKIANQIWSMKSAFLDENVLAKLVQVFKEDANQEVQAYAELLEEKINWSYHQWLSNLDGTGTSPLVYDQKRIIHVYKDEGAWIVEIVEIEGKDLEQRYSSREKLLDEFKLNGLTIEQVWERMALL